ncbi:MAG: hypothetical protein KC643_32205 [Nitrospira sp.]|nr:hypothetical protein [Nitrospira sp.]
MSKHETPMVRRYWRKIGGTLIEEFQVVARTPKNARRLIDGVIILGGPRKRMSWRDVTVKGKDVLVIQAKASRLGMYLLGQAIGSAELMKRLKPKSIRSVILCSRDDEEIRGILNRYRFISVEVMKVRSHVA